MYGRNVENTALLGAEIEHMLLDASNISIINKGNSGAVGCIISGSCRLHHNGELRVISERELYVIDNETQSVENFTNSEGTFEQVLLRINLPGESSDVMVSHRERERFDNAILQGIVANLSIEELAAMCCYSVSTFKRRFSKHYHQPPHKWLLQCRLMLAAKIMTMSSISITEVSSLCGFVNVSHFIATFRRHFSLTPSSMRNHSRQL